MKFVGVCAALCCALVATSAFATSTSFTWEETTEAATGDSVFTAVDVNGEWSIALTKDGDGVAPATDPSWDWESPYSGTLSLLGLDGVTCDFPVEVTNLSASATDPFEPSAWSAVGSGAACGLEVFFSAAWEGTALGGPDNGSYVWGSGPDQTGRAEVTVIPEPLTMAAVGMSLAGLGGYIRRRRRA